MINPITTTKLIVFVFVYFIATSSYASVEEKSVISRGIAETRQSALMQALSNAAAEAFGIELSSYTEDSSVSLMVDDQNESISLFVNALSQEISQRVTTSDTNPITGYSIISDRKTNEGWDIEVELRYAYYRPPGQQNTRRTAVVVSRKSDSEFIRDQVEKILIASRRFDVVSRRDVNLFENEKDFIRSDNTSRNEVARIGVARGADYLIIVDVTSMSRSINRETRIELTGEIVYDSSFNMAYSIEVVEFSTREIKWSKENRVSRSTDQRIGNSQAWMSRFIEPSVRSSVDSLIAAIFPMRIISIEGETFLVNRGSEYLKNGDNFNVFNEGIELIDPETGESLGRTESIAGKARVLEVFPKFSRLEMTEGSLNETNTYILRRSNQTTSASSARNIQRTQSAPAPAPAPAPRQNSELEQKKSLFLN